MRHDAVLVLLLAGCAESAPERAAPASAPEPAPEAVVSQQAPALLAESNEVLDAALAAEDTALRNKALLALGLSRRSDALNKLEEALAEPEGERRFAAAQGLGALADPAASAVLRDGWGKEQGWAVQRELAIAAASCGAVEMIPLLEEALTAPKEELQIAAAWALAELRDPAGFAALEKLGHPHMKWVRKKGSDRWSRKVLSGAQEGSRVLAMRTLAELGTVDDVALAAKQLKAHDPLLQLFAAALVVRYGRAPVVQVKEPAAPSDAAAPRAQ